jgi:hypothetical protein
MGSGLIIFTLAHVAISLVGIVAGFVVLFGLLKSQLNSSWTALFLVTTVATSLTGFLFPFHHFLPSHAVGILSLLVLPVTIFALYRRHLVGHWRWVYVVSSMLALYLNVFVLVAQAFQKVPALKALAPTQSEPPFAAVQLLVLVAFIVLTTTAALHFRPTPIHHEEPALAVQ